MKGVEISVEPNPVRQNEAVTITVSTHDGGDPTGWLLRLVAAEGPIKLPPRRLDAYGDPRQGKADTYDCKVSTVTFEPGDYLVDLSPKGSFDPLEIASKRFTVVPQRIVIATAGTTGPDPNSALFKSLHRQS
ncbi:MAG: hypothetical protein OXU37_04765 [Thaumarchaeota archaeon]|nr:hypothetical protein [Nitrososphaerota archaeon]MDD9813562.1 hypothetical protein [Nitrososphaerota archaeon]MDD9843200.1 hypothetical protein [Nitrososphaerota archaeon]RNJ71828.1 MAG: hypothetical protein EB833_06175 [Thaumarchaeota archaeon S13]RNJ75117.1 MAG: hypothetical protein EB824_02235 [Thaumarchaeota archaeon S15]